MLRFLTRRLSASLFVLIAVISIVYLFFFSFPVDPAELLCDQYCTPELVAQIRKSLELDGSIFAQLWSFFQGLVVGKEIYPGTSIAFYCDAPCLGYSFRNNIAVSELIFDRIGPTVSLAFGAIILALLIGFSIAVIAVLNLNKRIDRMLQSTSMFLVSIQVFLGGLIVQYFLVYRWGLLPPPGYVDPFDDLAAWATGLVIPWLTLGLLLSGLYARLVRAKLIDLITADFVRTARSLGKSEFQVLRQTLLRPALGPAIAGFGLMLGELLGGAVLTELIFNIPGLGSLTADSIEFLDLPVLVGVLIVSATFVVLSNLFADVIHYLVDPRVDLET